jgi:hypothetical protein
MSWKLSGTAAGVVAFGLWLLTAILGLESLRIVHEIGQLIIVLLGGGPRTAESSAIFILFILALVYLVFIIGTGEYHRKRVGQARSWKLFGWTLGVELALVAAYYLFLA